MKRISTNMPNYDMSYYMRLREWKMNELQNKMAAQTRLKNLRDDPLAAGHATRYQSKIVRLERFIDNISKIRGDMALAEGNIRSGLDILQRVRELAVQGANGIYDDQQIAYMAEEVDQLLRELVEIANSVDGKGNYIFSGFRSKIEPFRVHTGRVEGSRDAEVVASVEYVGDNGRNRGEIDEMATLDFRLPGNFVFWAERQQIYSSVESLNYRVQNDSAIRIDGVEIQLKEGDNLYAIIDKINASEAPVKARLDPVENALALEGTFPHQIWPEDLRGTVLQDLGIIARGSESPPLNVADSAAAYGGSIFDMIITLRNGMYENDIHRIGGDGLRGIDDAVEALTAHLAEIGSKDSRLQITEQRLEYERPEYIGFLAKEADLDITEAIMDLKMLEYAHQAAVGTAARIIRPTLLDFLR
ncbi:MAG: flagellar hook-associated protein 3 [Spirochaetia bacterium]|jgi:flagellar hook-associated protein 3 FlgL